MRALPFLACIAACSPATVPARTPARPVAASAEPAAADNCPLTLEGALVEVKDVDLGVALEFTSYGDVSELRRRVRLLGDVEHATSHHRYVEDVEGGARIVFPSGLRPEVAAFAQDMEKGSCPVTLPTSPASQVVTR